FRARRKNSSEDFTHAVAQLDEPPRFSRLALERVSLAVYFRKNVVDAREILPGRFETRFGKLPFGLELRDACGFFNQSATVVRFRAEQLAYASLLDDCIAVRPEPRAEEDVLDIAKPAGFSIEHVDALAGAVQAALDDNLAWTRVMAIPVAVAISIP